MKKRNFQNTTVRSSFLITLFLSVFLLTLLTSINSSAQSLCELSFMSKIDQLITSTPHAKNGVWATQKLSRVYLNQFILKLDKYLTENMKEEILENRTKEFYKNLSTVELKIPTDLTGNHLKPSNFRLVSALHNELPGKTRQQLILKLKPSSPVDGELIATDIAVILNFVKNSKTGKTEFIDYEVVTD